MILSNRYGFEVVATVLLRQVLIAPLVLALHLGAAFAQEKRVALVIGNSSYTSVPALRNPANDASDIAEKLTDLDFDVALALDASLQVMQQRLTDFVQNASDAELALVYFAGHGIEINGENYLIPVNANLQPNEDAAIESLPLTSVMQSIAEIRAAKIVLIDACRNNPFVDQLVDAKDTRSIGRGLTRVEQASGIWASNVLVGYAAKEGTVALDGEDRNSPYAQAILEFLEQPGLEVSKLFRKVGDRVLELTSGRQEPFTYGALRGEDIFLAGQSTMELDFDIASASGTAADWDGFLKKHRTSDNVALLGMAKRLRDAARVLDDSGSDGLSASEETAFFEAVRMMGTPRAWAIYFDKYPAGMHREEALNDEAELFRKNLQERSSGRDLASAKPLDWMRSEAIAFFKLNKARQLAIQSALARLGYSPGNIDGVLGEKSFGALANFQRDRRLLADGVVDRATLEALDVGSPEGSNVSWFPVAATLGQRQNTETVQLVESDSRVHRLFEAFQGSVVNYRFFGGNLYAVVRTEHVPWIQLASLTAKAGGTLAAIETAEEEEAILDLFRYDSWFWIERKSAGEFKLVESEDLHIIGPTFGLYLNETGAWQWATGEEVQYSNWNAGFPKYDWPRRYGEFVHGRLTPGASPSRWRWGNWDVSRNSILVEIE